MPIHNKSNKSIWYVHAVEYYTAMKRKDMLLSHRMDPQTKCVTEAHTAAGLLYGSLYIKLKTGRAIQAFSVGWRLSLGRSVQWPAGGTRGIAISSS